MSAILLGAVGCFASVEPQVVYVPPAPPPTVIAVERFDTDPTCLSTFHPVLAPYGAWIDDPEHGTIWIPDATVVGAGFAPYVTSGHWSYTAEGYVWISDHPWGWATFHYGRWLWTPTLGWVWVPGAQYRVAWVEWRYGGGVIGWAPMPPMYRWRGGYAYQYEPPRPPYVFVHSQHFFAPSLTVVLLPPHSHGTLFATTTRWVAPPARGQGRPFVGPEPIVAGIPRAHVARATRPPPAHALPHAVPWVTRPAPPSTLPTSPKVAPPPPKVAPPPPKVVPPPPKVAPPPPKVVPPPPKVAPPPPKVVPPPPKSPARPTKPLALPATKS